MSDQSDNSMSNFSVFLMGALAGAGLAILFAPRSGAETREQLARKGREVKDRAEQALNDVKEMMNNKKTEIAAAVEAAKTAMRDERARQSMPG